MQGFLVFDYASRYADALEELSKWVRDEKIKTRETIVRGGLEQAESTLLNVYNGVNTGTDTSSLRTYASRDLLSLITGKLLVEVCPPDT